MGGISSRFLACPDGAGASRAVEGQAEKKNPPGLACTVTASGLLQAACTRAMRPQGHRVVPRRPEDNGTPSAQRGLAQAASGIGPQCKTR